MAASFAGPAGAGRVAPPVEARATLAPAVLLFGDTVTARVDVVVDRARVDPDSVRVAIEFAPWQEVAPAERRRLDGGATSVVTTTYRLRCLISACVPSRDSAPHEFDPALVTYRGGTLQADWPVLVVYSRTPAAAESERRSTSPWEADLVSLPAVSYRLRPGLVEALLFALAGVLVLAGALLAWWAVPRRAAPVAKPAAPPAPVLTPLELALTVLEEPAGLDGAADRRRALALVADMLTGADPEAASAARALAWSRPAPAAEDTNRVAARARSALAEENDARA